MRASSTTWFSERFRLDKAGTGIFVRQAKSGGRETQLLAGTVDSFDWSNDGRLVFTRSSSGPIYVANADGSGQRKLTSGRSPVWSPDGKRIAFVHDDGVYVLKESGDGLARIAEGTAAAWSPDGRRLAIAGERFITILGHWGPPIRVPGGFSMHELDWSPDASRIAFAADDIDRYLQTMAVVDVDEGTRRRIAKHDCYSDAYPCLSTFTGVDWSPDGKSLVYGRRQFGEKGSNSQLHDVNVAARASARPLTVPSSPVRATVSVRRASDGELRWRRTFGSEGVRLALSRSFVTVRSGSRIEVYDARTGVHRTTLPRPARSGLIGISGSRAILVSRRRGIIVLDLRSGRKTVRPIRWGVAYEQPWLLGRKVVWVEGNPYGGVVRIRAVTLD